MSNFFEQELRKLFGDGEIIHDPVFVGRACVGGLDAGRQVRAEFVTMGHADHYEALRLTLLDNDLGVVDKLTLRLKDLWGKKEIPNNPYLKSGVDPHIWVNDGKTDWYAYHPTPSDYQQLRQAAGSYLDAFRSQNKEHSPKLIYICAPLRARSRKTLNLPGRKPRRCFCRGMCRYAPTSCFRPLPTPVIQPGPGGTGHGSASGGALPAGQCVWPGLTPGMRAETQRAQDLGIPVIFDQKQLEKTRPRPKRGRAR